MARNLNQPSRRSPCEAAPRRRDGGLGLGLLAVAAAATTPSLALAQSASFFDRDDHVGVLDRPRPDYQALGVHLGAFTVFPSLTVAPEYDDNIFATTDNRKGDFVTVISPAVQLRSNWSRNEVDAYASSTTDIYASNSTENTTDYQFGAAGRLDILSQSNVSAGFGYGHETEPRTAEDTITSATEPVQYDLVNANVGALQGLNKLRFSEGVSLQRTTYDNITTFGGQPLELSLLDNNAYVVSGRADYELTPEFALFVSAAGNDRDYDAKPPQALIDRNSTGYELTVGADFDVTRLVRGHVQVGYLNQDYRSSIFHTVSGPAVHARVEYYVTGLDTLTFTADRAVVDAVDPVAVSLLQTDGGVRIDHELLRNVILSAQANYETDSFTGVDRDDRRVSASFSGTYLLNRHVGVTAGYSLLNEDSSGLARIGNYLVNVVSLSIVFQL